MQLEARRIKNSPLAGRGRGDLCGSRFGGPSVQFKSSTMNFSAIISKYCLIFFQLCFMRLGYYHLIIFILATLRIFPIFYLIFILLMFIIIQSYLIQAMNNLVWKYINDWSIFAHIIISKIWHVWIAKLPKTRMCGLSWESKEFRRGHEIGNS